MESCNGMCHGNMPWNVPWNHALEIAMESCNGIRHGIVNFKRWMALACARLIPIGTEQSPRDGARAGDQSVRGHQRRSAQGGATSWKLPQQPQRQPCSRPWAHVRVCVCVYVHVRACVCVCLCVRVCAHMQIWVKRNPAQPVCKGDKALRLELATPKVDAIHFTLLPSQKAGTYTWQFLTVCKSVRLNSTLLTSAQLNSMPYLPPAYLPPASITASHPPNALPPRSSKAALWEKMGRDGCERWATTHLLPLASTG
eukprot:1156305-Pelagomonas_calceolata.AAC.7